MIAIDPNTITPAQPTRPANPTKQLAPNQAKALPVEPKTMRQ